MTPSKLGYCTYPRVGGSNCRLHAAGRARDHARMTNPSEDVPAGGPSWYQVGTLVVYTLQSAFCVHYAVRAHPAVRRISNTPQCKIPGKP